MPGAPIEIITGRERRRRWSVGEKLQIVAETQDAGVRVTDVAARHDVYPSLLFLWRRQVREGRLGPAGSPEFVPVRLLASSQEPTAQPVRLAVPAESRATGIEITLPDGVRLHIRDATQLPLLRPVIAALRG
ncbi:MAG TPA: transposase [Acetobacteraceae bacterium]|jgi:transposase